jgi:hypothetical protein
MIWLEWLRSALTVELPTFTAELEWAAFSLMLRSRVSEADKFIPVLTQFIYNWCQDFEMELANAAVEDNSYYANRIRYCQDFLRIFPNSDMSIIKNMLKAVNESHDLLKK